MRQGGRPNSRGVLVLGLLATTCWGGEAPLWPQCLETVGVRAAGAALPGVDGAAVTVGLVELSEPGGYAFMPNWEHACLQGAQVTGRHYYTNPYRQAGYSQHASHIAGLLFGDGPFTGGGETGGHDGGWYRGIVPGARVELYEANWFLYQRVMGERPEATAADVLTCSWGADADDALTMYWQRGLDALVMRQGVVVAAGAGNGGPGGIRKPSWGYNVIRVGVARSLGAGRWRQMCVGAPWPNESTFGPTDDGRSKPELIAPGLCLGPAAGANDVYQCPETRAYSSYATAQVAGAAAWLVDAARRQGLDEADDWRVVKALLMNGANKLLGWHRGPLGAADRSEYPLDWGQGAGLLNLEAARQQMMAGRYGGEARQRRGWDFNAVAGTDGGVTARRYELADVAGADETVTATLVWGRAYREDALFTAEPLSRLALELWSVADDGQLDERLDLSDSPRDTVAHVYWHSERPRRVALVVRHRGGGAAPAEHYGLAFAVGQENWPGDELAGDVSQDGVVDEDDLRQWAWQWERWGSQPYTGEWPFWLREDVNVDGRLDMRDIQLIIDQWGQRSRWAE